MRLGIAGLGAAGRAILSAIDAHPGVELAAVCDPSAEARERVGASAQTRAVAEIEALLADPDLDGVYIATPTELHERHAVLAAQAGKHVLVEKPMAVDIPAATRMIEAAERAGVVLLVGHSHSYDEPYRAIREVIVGGELGRVRMMQSLYFSDWLYRPRRPEELDARLGGGVAFRQGAHQFDILRLLGGGLVRTVRAQTFDWDPQRRATGAYQAFLTFEDGIAATAIYNGYGAFLSVELCWGIGELGERVGVERSGVACGAFRLRSGGEESAAKRARAPLPEQTRFQPFFGSLIVSCEGGDIRQSPEGLYLYNERGREERVLRGDRGPREAVLAEFVDAICGTRAPLHDGRWGRATLEVCAAVIASSEAGREVTLVHQVPTESSSLQSHRSVR